jgi:hypothetical protein
VDDKYFRERNRQLFIFPQCLSLSKCTQELDLNEQAIFALEILNEKKRFTASLFNSDYIPEFEQAVKLFKTKTVINASI